MKKLLIILLGPLLLGPAGYFLGKMLMPEPAPPVEMAAGEANESKPGTAHVTTEEILYKMPLGKFTVQVMQPDNVLHLVFSLDVYMAGAAEFERLNGSEGRAMLRDAAIAVMSDMAETTLWVDKGEEHHLDKLAITEEIVRKMHRKYSAVRSARMKELNTARVPRM